MSSSETPHLVLVGLSGAGKSTLAPLLVTRTGRSVLVDIDHEVEQRAGRTVAEIFEADGEAAFRELETEALIEALHGPPAVIATGGGVVVEAENRRALRAGPTVVWLRGEVDHLAQRLADTTDSRPLLAGDPHFALRRLADEREALYAEVADLVVDVDGADPRDLADELAARLS